MSRELPRLLEQLDAAEPFPHVVIYDFLNEEIAEEAFSSFPPPNTGEWTHYKHMNERKMGRSQVSEFPPVHRRIAATLSEPFFVDFVSAITGLPGLFADPDLEGGGLHQTESGGFLSVHTDFSAHSRHPSLARRVNVLLFFNKDWEEAYGGDLEF